MYLRRLKGVSKKTSLLRCFWEVFEMSLSMEICLRHLRDISCRLGSKFSSGISNFFSFTYIRLFCTDWRELQEKNLFNSIIRILLLNLSQRQPPQVSLLFWVLSLNCGIFKCLNCLRFQISPFFVLITNWFLFVPQVFLY